MKKTAYLTPDIREMDMDVEDLLVYSVKGEGIQIDNTEDSNPDNRSRRFCDIWGDEDLD